MRKYGFLDEFKDHLESCLQDEPAFCAAACPFRFDIKDFITKMQSGRFNAAFRAYHNAVGFPGIVCELCHEPCRDVCVVGSVGGAVSLRLLEKASMDYASRTTPNSYYLPVKENKVAIIGAGPSGLACALRLASKKYQVTVFEKTGRIGGHLWEVLPPQVFLADFQKQFMYEKYDLRFNSAITDLRPLRAEFDAIYVASGQGGSRFGLSTDPKWAFACTTPGVFLGGSLLGIPSADAIAQGLSVVSAIERFLKAGTMTEPLPEQGTKLKPDPGLILNANPVLPSTGSRYTKDEAVAEAKRCILCSCDACLRHCDMIQYFGKLPKRIEEEVYVTIYPGTLDHNGTVCTRLISSCNYSGICKEVCPQGIDVDHFLLQSHRAMREKGAMPWVFHDFWLRDLVIATGAEASLSRLPKGCDQSDLVFFPGCQLGASDPGYVAKSYEWLLEANPRTALLLSCCGAPADWAGDAELHSRVVDKMKADWVSLGRPKAVLACPTCKKMLGKYLPEIETVFLYELMARQGTILGTKGTGKTVSVFDSCASRNEPEVQQGIRDLLGTAGFALEPLPDEGRLAKCCSYGGQISIAAPEFADAVAKKRALANDNPYVVYCSNCRDVFAKQGKAVYHVLDLAFGLNDEQRAPPTATKRRQNRVDLKNLMLDEYWEGSMKSDQKETRLFVTGGLQKKLDAQLILESDVRMVIEHCEGTGRKLLDPGTGFYTGHLKIGNMTYWAVYVPVEEGFVLKNAYSHRMEIEEDR